MNKALILKASDLRKGMLVSEPDRFASTGGLFSVVTSIHQDGCVRIHPYSWPIGHSSGRLLAPLDSVIVLAKDSQPVIVEV